MSDLPPDWAIEKALAIMHCGYVEAALKGCKARPDQWLGQINVARYIAEHEEAPVDPLLIEARKLAGAFARSVGHPNADAIERGDFDTVAQCGVSLALDALRRGMEIERNKI